MSDLPITNMTINIPKIVGFSGTRHGMTEAQRNKFKQLIIQINPVEFHHGDCVGSDFEAHFLVRNHVPRCVIIIHPPTNSIHRAGLSADVILQTKPYLDRNRDIVDLSEVLIATSSTQSEQMRSGTWSTVRYSRSKKLPCVVILPDGTFST